MDTNPPSERKFFKEIGFFKVYVIDGLPPSFLKNSGELLTSESAELPGSVWVADPIPKDECKAMIVPIYKEDNKFLCEYHRGIILVSFGSKRLGAIILRRLFNARQVCAREIQIYS